MPVAGKMRGAPTIHPAMRARQLASASRWPVRAAAQSSHNISARSCSSARASRLSGRVGDLTHGETAVLATEVASREAHQRHPRREDRPGGLRRPPRRGSRLVGDEQEAGNEASAQVSGHLRDPLTRRP